MVYPQAVVRKNGEIVVVSENDENLALRGVPGDRDGQILAVRSTDGGRSWSAPVQVAPMQASLFPNGPPTDYPQNFFGAPTLTGHQFIVGTLGDGDGLAADPVTGTLWAVWTDNRDGIHDANRPPVTDTNVFLARSTDGGRTWRQPIRVSSGPGDKFMPAVAARGGRVAVLYLDGGYSWPSRDKYGTTLAITTNQGRTFTHHQLGHVLSDPNQALWLRAGISGCQYCAWLIGDYNGLTIDRLGRIHAVWSDFSLTKTCTVTTTRHCEASDGTPLARGSTTGRLNQVFYARR